MSLTRLVLVEYRKSVDTRASLCLLTLIALLGAGSAVIGSADSSDLATFVGSALLPLPVLLPVIAVLAVTGDWSRRAALTTFALVPRRSLVLVSRTVAALLLVVSVAASVTVIASIVFTLLHAGQLADTKWAAVADTLWSVTALAVSAAFTGVAMGYLLLNTPLALAVTLLVPITYDIAISVALPHIGGWISSLAFSQWLAQPVWVWAPPDDAVIGLGQALTSLLLWTALPLGAGWIRQLRKEVR